jgi:hypothetical protein
MLRIAASTKTRILKAGTATMAKVLLKGRGKWGRGWMRLPV